MSCGDNVQKITDILPSWIPHYNYNVGNRLLETTIDNKNDVAAH